MKVKDWVRRVCHLNIYLRTLSGGQAGRFFGDRELNRKSITPNIPVSWTKDYRLHRGHELNQINRVIKLLEEIECVETREERTKSKDSNKSKGSRSQKKDGNESKKPKKTLQNPCKLKGHKNHEWKDCYNNPKSENFKGVAKSIKDEAKTEENNLIEQLEEESCEEEFHCFERFESTRADKKGARQQSKSPIRVIPTDEWMRAMEGQGQADRIAKATTYNVISIEEWLHSMSNPRRDKSPHLREKEAYAFSKLASKFSEDSNNEAEDVGANAETPTSKDNKRKQQDTTIEDNTVEPKKLKRGV